MIESTHIPTKNKKILFVITKSNFGGAQRYVLDLADSLKQKGFEVKVAMGGDGILFDKLARIGIPTIKIKGLERDINLLNEIKASVDIFRIFRRERPDVVHLNSSKAGLGALAARLCSIRKIIFTLHGLAINEERNAFQKILIRIIYFLTIRLSHVTIAVSESLKTQVEHIIPFIKNRVMVIHNGINPPTYHTKQEARSVIQQSIEPKKLDLQLASLSIGTIGELHPIKGHNFLLEGFKEALRESALPLYLFIIGDGQEKAKTQRQIDELELTKNVFLCGHIDNAVSVLKAFDMFILPSISEGLPYAVLEAGGAGLATICSKVGGIPEIIQDGENGILIEPRSSNDIAEAILTLAFDHHVRKSLGSNLHKTIADEFTIQKMFDSTVKLYN